MTQTADRTEQDRLAEVEQFRTELRGYCYRMLGSTFDADDAVQETLVKAWQNLDRFEGRSSLRSWLYRIATNVCLDSLRSRSRRALPMDLSSPQPATSPVGDPLPGEVFVEPALDGDVVPLDADPARRAVLRDSVRLAFVAALQNLPPRQRAVLVLREVLGWQAGEVAELLDTTVASVNSALQRARATLGDGLDEERRPEPLGGDDAALLQRYVAAFEAYDIEALVQLLHEDASLSMPPLPLWLQGSDSMHDFYLGTGAECRGSRLVPLEVNASPGFAHYKPDPDGGFTPWSVQVLEIEHGRIAHIHHFLDPAVFPRFGLPERLPAEG
jgi:RNA polymerase sigma-70 factor (ECF subfamily)